MTTGTKTLRGAVFLFACMAWVGSPAWAVPGTHPDGPAATYRGWGPAASLADGYECTLFDSLGIRVGAIQFHADGRTDLTLGGQEAHFVLASEGLTDFHDLDTTAFPSIPTRFQNKPGYQLMIFSGRFAVGDNMFVDEPVTELAGSVSLVEARCVYIVDDQGNVVWCLNCIFTIS